MTNSVATLNFEITFAESSTLTQTQLFFGCGRKLLWCFFRSSHPIPDNLHIEFTFCEMRDAILAKCMNAGVPLKTRLVLISKI